MRAHFTLLFVLCTLWAVGCGGSSSQDPIAATQSGPNAPANLGKDASPTFAAKRPAKKYDNPADAVADFLVAVKSGHDEAATGLLTTKAQQEAWTNGLAISSDGFSDAQFNVSEVEYLNDNQEAHVMSVWSDITSQGQRKAFECVWLLRHESHGWCIYGMATKFLDDAPPVVLNFENQREMQQRQQWAEEQIVQRGQNPTSGTTSENRTPIRQATHTTPAVAR